MEPSRFVMRYLCALVLLCAAVGAGAQDPVPDPTPAHRYFPLAVGNEWEYITCTPDLFQSCVYTRSRDVITEAIEIDGVEYFRRESHVAHQEGWSLRGSMIIRFDTTSATVMAHLDGGEHPASCALDADFWSQDSECGFQVIQGEQGGDLPEGRVKEFHSSDSSEDYLEGVGYLGGYFWTSYTSLTYARVQQSDGSVIAFGRRYQVTAEDGPEFAALAVTVGPNPTAGSLAVTIEAAEASAATVEVFDVRGRRIESQFVGLRTGRQRVEVDAAWWAPGLYLVRVTSGAVATTARVVRR